MYSKQIMEPTKTILSTSLLAIFTMLLMPSFSYAGGCSPQPTIPDLNCSLNGPYGPSGPSAVECRAECRALNRCRRGGGSCTTEAEALDKCVEDGSLDSTGLVGTIGFDAGVGCVLQRDSVYPSTTASHASSADGLDIDECTISDTIALSGSSAADLDQVVKETAGAVLGYDSSELSISQDLYADLHGSWSDVQRIARHLGAMFDVKVADEVVDNMNTVGDLINCVNSASGI